MKKEKRQILISVVEAVYGGHGIKAHDTGDALVLFIRADEKYRFESPPWAELEGLASVSDCAREVIRICESLLRWAYQPGPIPGSLW